MTGRCDHTGCTPGDRPGLLHPNHRAWMGMRDDYEGLQLHGSELDPDDEFADQLDDERAAVDEAMHAVRTARPGGRVYGRRRGWRLVRLIVGLLLLAFGVGVLIGAWAGVQIIWWVPQ